VTLILTLTLILILEYKPVNMMGNKISILFSCPVVAIFPQKNRNFLRLRRLLELLMLRTVPELGKVYPLHVRPQTTLHSTFFFHESIYSHTDASNVAKAFGYTEEQLKSVPEAAHMGLSCGNPIATASIKEVS
jgi:hypothetical protein